MDKVNPTGIENTLLHVLMPRRKSRWFSDLRNLLSHSKNKKPTTYQLTFYKQTYILANCHIFIMTYQNAASFLLRNS